MNLVEDWKARIGNIRQLDLDDSNLGLWMLQASSAFGGMDLSCALRYLGVLLSSPTYRWMRGEIVAMRWAEEKFGKMFFRTPLNLTGDLMSVDGEVLIEVATQRSSGLSTKRKELATSMKEHGFKRGFAVRIHPDTMEVVEIEEVVA